MGRFCEEMDAWEMLRVICVATVGLLGSESDDRAAVFMDIYPVAPALDA